MIERLSSATVQQFIKTHEHVSSAELLLKYRDVEGIPAAIIANQIAGRKKAIEKIPLYHNTEGILYPPLTNLEQSSSERTARFKAQILSELSVKGSCLDLSGGFGIDSFFLRSVCTDVTMIEPDNSLLALSIYNHKLLGATNIRHVNNTAAEFLSTSDEKFSLVFIDPSRRIEGNRKVYSLSESEPDVVRLREDILQRADYLLVKASPLLDIQKGLEELVSVSKVYIVSVDNECKELLFLVTKEVTSDPVVEAVNIRKDEIARFRFTISEERAVEVLYSAPLRYLYEPNASILKAGAFKIIASRYALKKLHPNTHLYTSDVLLTDFQGRVFEILADIKAETKILKEYFPEGKANIAVRNYPLDPPALKKKTKLKDGGDRFLLGFTSIERKHLVAARRVN